VLARPAGGDVKYHRARQDKGPDDVLERDVQAHQVHAIGQGDHHQGADEDRRSKLEPETGALAVAREGAGGARLATSVGWVSWKFVV
jgi:hypothetical protein